MERNLLIVNRKSNDVGFVEEKLRSLQDEIKQKRGDEKRQEKLENG